MQMEKVKGTSWKRILLLIIAITVHNIPEGLAVGVGFGAIGRSSSATFENARFVGSSEYGTYVILISYIHVRPFDCVYCNTA